MKRLLLILEGAIDPENSLWREGVPGLAPFLETGVARRLAPPTPQMVPETAWLGLAPHHVRMREGPLVVAALEVDPPERTLHFRLDPLDATGDLLKGNEELVRSVLPRLATKRLTTVIGPEGVHGLVREGWADLGTFPPGGPLPDGEGDTELRRFIDDSVNLLLASEENRRRVEDGLPAFGPLWPWAHGPRESVPNLALERGEIAAIDSPSIRFRGLARLAGLPGRGSPGAARIVHRSFVRYDDPEERAHRVRESLGKLDANALDRLTLLVPGPEGGLALTWDRERFAGVRTPFDERMYLEGNAPETSLTDLAREALTPE